MNFSKQINELFAKSEEREKERRSRAILATHGIAKLHIDYVIEGARASRDHRMPPTFDMVRMLQIMRGDEDDVGGDGKIEVGNGCPRCNVSSEQAILD